MMSELLGEVGNNISLQHSLLKSIIKSYGQNQCEKHKNSSLVCMWILVKIGKADWSMLEQVLLLHV